MDFESLKTETKKAKEYMKGKGIVDIIENEDDYTMVLDDNSKILVSYWQTHGEAGVYMQVI